MAPHTVVKRRSIMVRRFNYNDTDFYHITYTPRPTTLDKLRIELKDVDDLIAALQELKAQKEDA